MPPSSATTRSQEVKTAQKSQTWFQAPEVDRDGSHGGSYGAPEPVYGAPAASYGAPSYGGGHGRGGDVDPHTSVSIVQDLTIIGIGGTFIKYEIYKYFLKNLLR